MDHRSGSIVGLLIGMSFLDRRTAGNSESILIYLQRPHIYLQGSSEERVLNINHHNPISFNRDQQDAKGLES